MSAAGPFTGREADLLRSGRLPMVEPIMETVEGHDMPWQSSVCWRIG
jgi:hypothetical protein